MILFHTPSTTARFSFSLFSSRASLPPVTLVLPLSLSTPPAAGPVIPSFELLSSAGVPVASLPPALDPAGEKREGVRASGTAREECCPKKAETKLYSICALEERTREMERKRDSAVGRCGVRDVSTRRKEGQGETNEGGGVLGVAENDA